MPKRAFTISNNVGEKLACVEVRPDGGGPFPAVGLCNALGYFKEEDGRSPARAHRLAANDLDGNVLATEYEAFDLGYEVNVLFDPCYSRAKLTEATQKIILRNLQTKNP